MSNPIHDVDSHWARRSQCDPELLHEPGLHLIRGSDLNQPVFMRYVVPFFALFPSHTPNSVVITSTELACDEIAGWSLGGHDISADDLGPRLLEFAQGMNLEECYAFKIVVASPDELQLDLSGDVREVDRDSPDAVDWRGTRLSTEVDGRIFVISDAHGVSAWAGEKLTSDRARDIQVATREDVRRQGLARATA
jgi:hypothetical protein